MKVCAQHPTAERISRLTDSTGMKVIVCKECGKEIERTRKPIELPPKQDMTPEAEALLAKMRKK